MLSIRFEVGGCPSAAPVGGWKHVLHVVLKWKKFSNTRQLGTQYLPKLWRVPGLIESTAILLVLLHVLNTKVLFKRQTLPVPNLLQMSKIVCSIASSFALDKVQCLNWA